MFFITLLNGEVIEEVVHSLGYSHGESKILETISIEFKLFQKVTSYLSYMNSPIEEYIDAPDIVIIECD